MANTDPSGTGAVDPDLEPGEAVGEYVIDGKLGQGGFGAVFRASHPLIGKVVAIKVLARRFSVDPEMVERFQAEARAVNQIRHRHIIDIFSFGRLPDGRAYYAMEYLDGETLGDLLTRETKLSFAAALPILRAIARALDAAHGKGIAHRDLKPDNVFLARSSDPADPDVFPKLLDFGIAKLMHEQDGKSKTRTGIPMGTPYYMSPEQCRGRDVDHRTDYYAFGVVAYEMLTGTFPIDGEDFMAILMKQIGEDAPPASSRNPELPPGVDDVIAWLMQKDPAARPPSLAAAMQALDAVAEGVGIAVPRAPRSEPVSVPPTSRVHAAVPTPAGLPSTTTNGFSATAPVPALSQTVAPAAPPASRRGLVIGAAAAAVVLGIGAFALLRGGGQGDAARPPAPPQTAHTPAPPPPVPVLAPVVADARVAAPPVVPDRVTLTIVDAPDGTEVRGADGTVLGRVPAAIALPRGSGDVVLAFSAPGFVPASRTVHPTQDATLSVKLDKRPAVTAPPRPHPPVTPPAGGDHQNSLEDPFAK